MNPWARIRLAVSHDESLDEEIKPLIIPNED
jgi:hypothetical protein